jgi:SAM-dependent methyltransferase
MSRVDIGRLNGLRVQYAERVRKAGADSRYKYLDVAFYTLQKLLLAQRLGLDDGLPRRVLDIGTGGGHFPFVCRYLGHEVVGLDIENQVYEGIAACLGVERTIYRVEPGAALPALGGKFDLIVACNITFDEIATRDRERQRSYWPLAEWQYFLDDLIANQLRYPGRMYFKLNQQAKGRVLGFRRFVYNDVLLAAAERNGGVVSRRRGIIDMFFPSQPTIRLLG